MANIFTNGEELLSKKDFDKKVNIQKPLYVDVTNAQEDWSAFNPQSQNVNMLQAFGEKFSSPNDLMLGSWSAGLVFGGFNTKGIFEVDPYHHAFRVHGTDSNIKWQEDVAFKSDIDALKARISALEKQIGGVLSSLLNHLFTRIEVVA